MIQSHDASRIAFTLRSLAFLTGDDRLQRARMDASTTYQLPEGDPVDATIGE